MTTEFVYFEEQFGIFEKKYKKVFHSLETSLVNV